MRVKNAGYRAFNYRFRFPKSGSGQRDRFFKKIPDGFQLGG